MIYEKRILCFLDILGFGKIINDKILDATKINALFAELELIINEYNQDGIQITHFSDSVVISILRTTRVPTQLKIIVEILIKLLEYKLIARGAIVYGELIHDSKNIYGPALVKASSLEKEKAINPRIILHESLCELQAPTFGNAIISIINFFDEFKYIKKDSDNQYYIDLIGEIATKSNSEKYYDVLRKLIVDGLTNSNLKIVSKYEWLDQKMRNYTDKLEKHTVN
jgi:hypothetical protein